MPTVHEDIQPAIARLRIAPIALETATGSATSARSPAPPISFPMRSAPSHPAAVSRLVRPGGVIVHAGLLSGSEGLDILRITLQEVILTQIVYRDSVPPNEGKLEVPNEIAVQNRAPAARASASRDRGSERSEPNLKRSEPN